MGLRTLGIAASSLNAHLASQAAGAGNTANAVTPAFAPAALSISESAAAGAAVTLTSSKIAQGSLILTGNPLDLAIGGVGFFLINGKERFKVSRDGRFGIDADGYLATLSGERLSPEIHFPSDTTNAIINRFGDVVAQRTDGREYLGTIQLATIANPSGLRANGGTALEVTSEAGAIVRGFPGQSEFGLLVQGGLESSGVDLSDEVLNAITTARAFSANARVFKLAASVTEEVINLGGRPKRDKSGKTDIDLRRSQVAGLVSRISSETSKLAGRKLSDELRAQLRARRLSPGIIAREALSRRDHLNSRFDDQRVQALEEGASSSFLSQEIRLARRRGYELYQDRAGVNS